MSPVYKTCVKKEKKLSCGNDGIIVGHAYVRNISRYVYEM